jgi:hypothetical protein
MYTSCLPTPSQLSMKPTYHNSTGIKGAQHYCQCHNKHTLPLSIAMTVHPNKATKPAPTYLSKDPCIDMTLDPSLGCHPHSTAHSTVLALMGTAINQDTCKIVDNKHLSKCSEGPPLARFLCHRNQTIDTRVWRSQRDKHNVLCNIHQHSCICWTVGGNHIIYAADETLKLLILPLSRFLSTASHLHQMLSF